MYFQAQKRKLGLLENGGTMDSAKEQNTGDQNGGVEFKGITRNRGNEESKLTCVIFAVLLF
jgi:nuclear GTP-binding protein